MSFANSTTFHSVDEIRRCSSLLAFEGIHPQEGTSNPVSPDGMHIQMTNPLSVNSEVVTQQEDLLIHVNPQDSYVVARVEVSNIIKGEIGSIVLQSNSFSINQINSPLRTKKNIYGSSPSQLSTIRESTSKLYGFHFIAKSDASRDWKLVVTTDISEKRGKELGGVLSYEAHFSPPVGGLGYVYLPTGSFKSVFNGKLTDEPSIGDPAYLQKVLNLRSIAFETSATMAPTDLRIRNSEVGMGPFSGFNVEQAAEALVQSGRATSHYGDNYLVSNLLLRMKQKSENFPEGEIFKSLKTDSARRAYLNSELSKIRGPYTQEGLMLADEDLQGAVSFTQIWRSFIERRTITTETGFFGSLHGRYAHALQLIAMLKGATNDELDALYRVAGPLQEFNFFWTLALDSRTGDVNDPAWWLRRYEATLN